jgi:transposase-like protein
MELNKDFIMLHCPKCGSEDGIKSGIVREKQRYECKGSGCNYTQSSRYRIAAEKREEAIGLYFEGVGFRGIERLTNISHVTVMRWVKALADNIEVRSAPQEKRDYNMDASLHWDDDLLYGTKKSIKT